MRAINRTGGGLTAIAALGLALHAWAGGGAHGLAARCAHCGCQAECHKVSRLVCEEKKVPITCWGCKCEDFCIPVHSKKCCEHCELVCDEESADCDSPCTHAKRFVWTEWIPGCAKIFTKKKLMKKTVTKKIPSYKWVIEDLCAACEAKAPSAEIPPGASIPPPLANSQGALPTAAAPGQSFPFAPSDSRR